MQDKMKHQLKTHLNMSETVCQPTLCIMSISTILMASCTLGLHLGSVTSRASLTTSRYS